MKRVVIVGNGLFPQESHTLELLKGASDVVCCDAAILNLTKYYGTEEISQIPHNVHIVGDMDSLDQTHKERYASIIHTIPEQETNDQTKAFHFALTLNPLEIVIVGASGRRDDHTIANVSLVADYAQEVQEKGLLIKISSVTDFGTFYPVTESTTLNCRRGCEVSIFSFDPSLNIVSEGLQYQTDGVSLDMWWKATLNVALGDSFRLNLSHPAKVLVFISQERR